MAENFGKILVLSRDKSKVTWLGNLDYVDRTLLLKPNEACLITPRISFQSSYSNSLSLVVLVQENPAYYTILLRKSVRTFFIP